MARYNFYLKDKKAKKETSIILYVSYNSKFCKISTGLKILPSNWNYKKQNVKPQVSKSSEINNILSNFINDVEKVYLTLVNENVFITNDLIKNHFKSHITPKKEIDLFFSDMYSKIFRHFKSDDGGFSYFTRKSQTYYYGVKITEGLNTADIHGTTLLLWALSMIFTFKEDDSIKLNIIKP